MGMLVVEPVAGRRVWSRHEREGSASLGPGSLHPRPERSYTHNETLARDAHTVIAVGIVPTESTSRKGQPRTPPTQNQNAMRRNIGTMRAIVQDVYGTTETWRMADSAIPEIEPEEVLVRVHAAGLDRGTWHSMTGRPYLMRVMGFGLTGPKNRVPGLATAGTVVAIGGEVTRFSVGDEVYGVSRGAFAEFAAAHEEKLVRKPTNLTFEQAAAVPVSATTAMQAVQLGRVEAPQTVMVIGASGGVGTYAVQIAKALGAEVTGLSSTTKMDLVWSIGADHVIDYTRHDFTDGSRRYDVVLDLGGNTPLRELTKTLNPEGTLVIVGGENKGDWTGGFGRSLRAPAWSLLRSQRLTMLASNERYPSLEKVTELIEVGKVAPAIDRTFALDDVSAAMRHLEAGQARGKIVITI
jgi:NADPH:quinone reductase-like Zn-dependent oxidoreductase